ncbi:ETS1B protein, partial [Crypturellus undulatus]|nr:ETS1B protein [Crypturellus undulatus]
MSYYMDTTIGSPAPYPLARPGMMRQGGGAGGSYEDPWMSCGFQAACCRPAWDEAAMQEVPTGMEHYGA